jgi:hypothetical protein
MLATSHFFPPCLKDAAVLDISPVDFHEKTEMENSIVLHLHFSKTPWGKKQNGGDVKRSVVAMVSRGQSSCVAKGKNSTLLGLFCQRWREGPGLAWSPWPPVVFHLSHLFSSVSGVTTLIYSSFRFSSV